MALRNQPYFPLYTQDFISDEKLRECSAASVGVYIFLMCVFHKSEDYGSILLKQKDKQNPSKIKNFACKLSKHLPFDIATIEAAIQELVDTGVLTIEDDRLFQKRMVKDGRISDIRASAGKKGSQRSRASNNFAADFAAAKTQAKSKQNTENEIVIVNESEYVTEPTLKDRGVGEENDDLSPIKAVLSHYRQLINPQPSTVSIAELESFVNKLGAAVCDHAINIAADENKRGWAYIRSILAHYEREGITTMAQIFEQEQQHHQRKGIAKGGGQKPKRKSYAELAAEMDAKEGQS